MIKQGKVDNSEMSIYVEDIINRAAHFKIPNDRFWVEDVPKVVIAALDGDMSTLTPQG